MPEISMNVPDAFLAAKYLSGKFGKAYSMTTFD